MQVARYILRSLLHYRFAYLGVLLGTVLGATVLLGALFAGDSVTASLRRIGELRIGRTTHVLSAGDRFFRQALADDFASATKVVAAPVVYARGTAVHPATRATASQVQLIGVTDAFWKFAPQPAAVALKAAESNSNSRNSKRPELSVECCGLLLLSSGLVLIVLTPRPPE